MPNPWRDVYPFAFWNQLVAQYRSGVLKSDSATVGRWMRSVFKTGRVLPQQIERITSTLQDYHAVKKNDSQNFPRRINLLRSIYFDAAQYVDKYKINRTFITTPPAEDNFTSMDAYVWSIGKRALRKAAYIEEIQKFCDTEWSNPTKMLQYITDTRHNVDAFQHLQVGSRMEKLDPYHRSFEMHVKADGEIEHFNTSPMVTAFGEWIGAMKNKDGNFGAVNITTIDAPVTPFFVWLENHHLTVGGANQRWGYRDWGANDTKSVRYRDTLTDPGGKWWHWLCFGGGGALYELDLEGLSTTLFNTRDGEGKPTDAPFDTYAYVWTGSGELLAGRHNPDSVHHSSFTAGQKVRCAGMIAVNEAGKVTMVNSNSGHYHPTEQQLTLFVEWLKRRGVLSTEAEVRLGGSMERVPVATFLRSAPASNAIRSLPTVPQNNPAGPVAGPIRPGRKSI